MRRWQAEMAIRIFQMSRIHWPGGTLVLDVAKVLGHARRSELGVTANGRSEGGLRRRLGLHATKSQRGRPELGRHRIQ